MRRRPEPAGCKSPMIKSSNPFSQFYTQILYSLVFAKGQAR
jgi:hypothetical protein